MNPGDILNDKYRIEKLLGQGGMGAVYLAENQDVGRKVAIKLLRPEFATDGEVLSRFKSEARAAAAIGHPGIVDVLDMGVTPQGAPFIVMERLQGQTLRQRAMAQPPLSIEQAVGFIVQVLEVLSAAHAAGVIHRDLKPDNLFVVEKPVEAIKILDFGVSKFRDGPGANVTQTGQVMGTPLYMSPEQARGARDVGVAADLYSMGAILYELLSGRPPYRGQSYTEILAKLLTEPLPPLDSVRPGLPPALRITVERLLDKQPAARFPSAAEAAEALLRSLDPGTGPIAARSISGEVQALGQTTPSAQRASAIAARAASMASGRPPGRERLVAAGILGAGVVLCAAIWFGWHSTPPPPAVWTAPVTAPPPPVTVEPPSPAPAPAPVEPAPAPAKHHTTPTPPVPPSPKPTDHAPTSSAPGRFQGWFDQDSTILLPPQSLPHIHIPQGVALLDSGGHSSVTFDGPPPCRLTFTHVTSTSFAIDPNQTCSFYDRGVLRTSQIFTGKGSVSGNQLEIDLFGQVSGSMVQFKSSFSGSRH